MVSRYGPVKQEGICLLPPPPPHYRMMPPQRSDGFHVQAPPTYVSQGNQTGNQGPTLRGIAPTGPPNQASTPPNTDIKVQSVPQSTSLSHIQFVGPTPGVRPAFYRSAPVNPSASQTARMANRQGQQQMYQQPAPFVPVPVPAMYVPSNPMSYYPQSQRQQFVSQVPTLYQPNLPYSAFTQAQPQPSSVNYYATYPMNLNRAPPTQNTTTPQNNSQPNIANMSIPPAVQPQPTYSMQRPQNKRRPNAIAIIDPNTGIEIDPLTGLDRLAEVLDQDNSHPASGESSTSQTPQPKEVAATFAKQVAQVLNNDEPLHEDIEHPLHPEHIETTGYNTPQGLHNPSRLESIVQSSNLKAQAKEFVLLPAPKETPVVSANCDAIEVTLPNKPPKDRESPAKVRKPSVRDHKDSVKEQPVSSVNNNINLPEKQTIVKDEKQKETPVIGASSKGKDNSSVSQRDEKKSKKEVEVLDPQVPNVDVIEASTPPATSPAQPAQELKTNPKSRNSSRTKESHKQIPPQMAPKQAVAVPPPQPAKPSSKSSKKSELNLKGASKEGTDMDVFNDNIDNVNANVVINTTNKDIVNANNLANNNITSSTESTPVPTVKDIKKAENETLTIKIEPKITLNRNNYDVTSIVKEQVKQFIHPPPIPVEPQSQVEQERSMLNGDKLVKLKHEVNEPAMKKDGILRYSRETLMKLRESPLSKIKPEGLLDAVLPCSPDERGRIGERMSLGGRDFTNPPFPYPGKSGSQRGLPPKRNSQSGKPGGPNKGSKSGTNSVTKILTISIRDEIKLNSAKNAWKPACMISNVAKDEETKKTEDLYRKVRGVLNKLTPEKFTTLIDQVKGLPIDTEEKLKGVINLVFEKAVDEPNFSVAYALLCSHLAFLQVPRNNSDEMVNFRKLIISSCQAEFEKQSIDESKRNEMSERIEKCEDPEKKKQLTDELDEYDTKLRRKSVGNIRFIGELFKQNMLTVNIMHKCLETLIRDKSDESLECLCKLLSTIGKELEIKDKENKEKDKDNKEKANKPSPLLKIFETMEDLAGKHGSVCNRIRFMLKDILDLRKSNWVARRATSDPKTFEDLQKEASQEQAMHSMGSSSRRDDCGSNDNAGLSVDRKQRRNVSSEDGWTTRSSSRNPITVQSNKLKLNSKQQDMQELGSRNMFSRWIKGSNPQNNVFPSQNSNMYAALDPDRRTDNASTANNSRSSREPYSSKGSSLERSSRPLHEGRGSYSGPQHRSSDNIPLPLQRAASSSMTVPVLPPVVTEQKSIQDEPKSLPVELGSSGEFEPTEKELLRLKNDFIEYISDSCTAQDYQNETVPKVPESYYSTLVVENCLNTMDRTSYTRFRTSKLFVHLVNNGAFKLSHLYDGIKEVLSQTEDLAIDYPKIWEYVSELLVHVVCEGVLPLADVGKLIEVRKESSDNDYECLKPQHAALILSCLFKLIISEKGPRFLYVIWLESGLSLTDYISEDQLNEFVEVNNIKYLLDGNISFEMLISYEEVGEKLKEFFKSGAQLGEISRWIQINVGVNVKENKFIKALATAIFEVSISHSKFNAEKSQVLFNFLFKYVDNNIDLELQCLYALQALINKLEHPQGLLLTIFTHLCDEGILSQESFLLWEKSADPSEQEGKGVALKQLVSFFTQLKENDDAEDDIENDSVTGENEQKNIINEQGNTG